MFVFSSVIYCLVGTLFALRPDIEINRLQRVPNKESIYFNEAYNPHNRRSIESYQLRNNDYDDYSGGISHSSTPLRNVYHATSSHEKTPIKVHQPREDPKLYYQSDAYLKEINRENINEEVRAIYPGREVIRAGDTSNNLSGMRSNYINKNVDLCVKCPRDRTLVAKPHSDFVIIQTPRLLTCSDRLAPRNVYFSEMYGTTFNTLLGPGSHMVMGSIMRKNKVIKVCKMEIHVVLQNCPLPKYLLANCKGVNLPCNFTCRDKSSEIHGRTSLTCEKEMEWDGELPVCRGRTWCEPPPPPEHGRVTCKGITGTDDVTPMLSEGTRCRVRCDTGYRWSPRAATVCRRGTWTHELTCQPKRTTYN